MYGMRFAQIAQDMCNYLDAQTQDLAPNEALLLPPAAAMRDAG